MINFILQDCKQTEKVLVTMKIKLEKCKNKIRSPFGLNPQWYNKCRNRLQNLVMTSTVKRPLPFPVTAIHISHTVFTSNSTISLNKN